MMISSPLLLGGLFTFVSGPSLSPSLSIFHHFLSLSTLFTLLIREIQFSPQFLRRRPSSMADVDTSKLASLAEDYLLEKKEQTPVVTEKPVEDTEVKSSTDDAVAVSEETVEKTEEALSEVAPAAEEDSAPVDEATDNANPAPSEDNAESDNSVDQESDETPEIKLETAPADFRFPTTNQTRHCFTRYIEYHRCIAAKGEGAPECDKFAKYYRSLCPGEWIDRWNEQRENGTFPGPL